MSMLGSQIDELRTAAQTERTFGHHELEQMLLDAADTIWQLRDDLQRANAAVQDAEHDESMAWDRVRKAEAENAKLRELCEDMFSDMVNMDFSLKLEGRTFMVVTRYESRLRELGVEVKP